MNINQILSAKEYADIFTQNLSECKVLYRDLCKICHPDVCKDKNANEAFSKLNSFYKEAISAIQSGNWKSSKLIKINVSSGKSIQFKPLYFFTFELGKCYVTDLHIIYIFDFSKKKFYNNYRKKVENLFYIDDKMRKKFKPLFPSIYKEYDSDKGQHILVLNKPKEIYPFKAVMENFYKGNIPARHLAWIITRLINICAYFKMNNLVHNGINIDNCFIDLSDHSIYLFGGWYYCVNQNEKMIGTTKDIFNVMTPKVKANKTADFTTDIESVKALGRKLIRADAPTPFIDFLNSGSSDDAVKELSKWEKALNDSFGKRKFIVINSSKEQIYNL